jgi:hypothetical protein
MLRGRLTPDEIVERENDPSSLVRYHYRHPWIAGPGAGLTLAAIGIVRGYPWFVPAGIGLAMFLWTGLAWRPGGAGQRMRRWALRRYPRK